MYDQYRRNAHRLIIFYDKLVEGNAALQSCSQAADHLVQSRTESHGRAAPEQRAREIHSRLGS